MAKQIAGITLAMLLIGATLFGAGYFTATGLTIAGVALGVLGGLWLGVVGLAILILGD